MAGPLDGVRVVELAGIGPGPFAGMMLADMGADVVRVDRPDGTDPLGALLLGTTVNRGRRSIAVDLKQGAGRDVVLDLAAHADVLLEGFRPGVAERLGLGPDDCARVNPRLVYGRMTGWGQDGPLASTAGHDIDYIALTGALHAARRAGERPVPPVNLLGDFGGGGMVLAFGVVCALLDAARSGRGQVIDASIVDGTAVLTNFLRGMRAVGGWPAPPGQNLLDTGAPFYEVYACADGREVAVGALEDKFYAELVRLSGTTADCHAPDARMDPSTWPSAKQAWADLFATRTRTEWMSVFGGSDACVAPVLDWDEAPEHPHNAARGTFVQRAGSWEAVPAPRFSRTPASAGAPPPSVGADTDAVLSEIGRSSDDIDALRGAGVVA